MGGFQMLTLRQVEVVRAIMVSGSVAGAARHLNVSQPGISRLMKHMEATLGIRLFVRSGGRYVPAEEARTVFEQINDVHRKIDDLQFAIDRLAHGGGVELQFGSVPSIANVMVPRAVVAMQRRYRDLRLNIDIIKIEEAIDYLMLGRGEVAMMSYRLDHPSLVFEPLASGRLVFIAAPGHETAHLKSISVEQIARYPLIGIDPNDPYGRIMASLFERHGVDYSIPIRARFGTTVMALVERDAGVAVIDTFSVADIDKRRLAIIPIEEETEFQAYYATKRDHALSSFAQSLIAEMRAVMADAAARR
jgi:DNA-binding transcriptional LysR family regulator